MRVRRKRAGRSLVAEIRRLERILAQDDVLESEYEDEAAAEEAMMDEVVGQADEELLRETEEIGDEEAEIAEESTGIPVEEEQEQNDKANENWPLSASERKRIAVRLVRCARALIQG